MNRSTPSPPRRAATSRAHTGLALASLALVLSATGAQAVVTVDFIPGTYELAEAYSAPPVDTLVVTVSGGTASFDLTGEDNATFTVPDASTPTGTQFSSPYYAIAGSAITASWDTTAYGYLTFWSNANDGGITAGDIPGDQGVNLFNTFQSNTGAGQVFTISGVPEPAAWAMMLVGMTLVGGALRARREARGLGVT